MGLRLLTSGESHGEGLVFVLTGFPAGVKIAPDNLSHQLARRRGGLGRSPRMKLEMDSFRCLSGIRGGTSTGNPISFLIHNVESEKWSRLLHPWEGNIHPQISVPRPGHADLPGAIKFGSILTGKFQPGDIRNVIERASARETAARVLAGAICRTFLDELSIKLFSFVFQIGRAKMSKAKLLSLLSLMEAERFPIDLTENNSLRIPDDKTAMKAKNEILRAQRAGTTLGGAFAVMAFNVPIGLGSFEQWDTRLDGKIAQAILSIPAVKACAFGQIPWKYCEDGASYQDEIRPSGASFAYCTNNDGGLNGGISNGAPIVVTALMKPLPTQAKPLRSVDLRSGKEARAFVERHDVTSVPAASTVAEAMLAFILASEILDVYGGNELSVIKNRVSETRALTQANLFGQRAGRL